MQETRPQMHCKLLSDAKFLVDEYEGILCSHTTICVKNGKEVVL